MKVYVIKSVYDEEYGGYKIDFITSNEDKAKQYCKEHNKKFEHWDGDIYDSVYYDSYEVED